MKNTYRILNIFQKYYNFQHFESFWRSDIQRHYENKQHTCRRERFEFSLTFRILFSGSDLETQCLTLF